MYSFNCIVILSFLRKDRAESASCELKHRHIMKDLLGDMHQLKDANDIDKSKTFTRSILFEKQKKDNMSLKEYQFQTLKPIEDFIRPDDQFSPRLTGYEHGHIRSLLKLDVYGPAGSSVISKERELGTLPRSPNVDRHSVLSANNTRPGTGTSVASSRASTANSTNYNGAFPSLKSLRRDRAETQTRTLGGSGLRSGDWGAQLLNEQHHLDSSTEELSATSGASLTAPCRFNGGVSRTGSLAHSSSGGHLRTERTSLDGTGKGSGATAHLRVKPDDTVIFAGPGLRPSTTGTSSSYNQTARTGTSTGRRGKYPEQTFPGVAIAEEERLQGGDPFLRRTTWYKSFSSSRKVSFFNGIYFSLQADVMKFNSSPATSHFMTILGKGTRQRRIFKGTEVR